MADEATKLQAVGEFISKLTPRSLVLGILAGVSGIALYQLFEAREAAFAYLIASHTLLLGIGAGLVMLGCGWIVSVSLKRLEEYLQAKIDEQAATIEHLRGELKECRQECRDGTTKMLSVIVEKLDGR